MIKKSFHLQSKFNAFKQKESEFKKGNEKSQDEMEPIKPDTEKNDDETIMQSEDESLSKKQTPTITEEDLIVEKDKLGKDWKEFEREREKVRELGLRVKDVRTLTHEKELKNPTLWKYIGLFLGFLLVLVGSVAVVVNVF